MIYNHTECSPRNPVMVMARLEEFDTTKTEEILYGALEFAGILMSGAGLLGYGSKLGSVAGFSLSAGTFSGKGISSWLDGGNDLGMASGVVPEDGLLDLHLNGKDGSALVIFRDYTIDGWNASCGTSAGGIPTGGKETITGAGADQVPPSISITPIEEGCNPTFGYSVIRVSIQDYGGVKSRYYLDYGSLPSQIKVREEKPKLVDRNEIVQYIIFFNLGDDSTKIHIWVEGEDKSGNVAIKSKDVRCYHLALPKRYMERWVSRIFLRSCVSQDVSVINMEFQRARVNRVRIYNNL